MYRILEKTDVTGVRIFIPQYKKFFIFWCFYEVDFFPKLMKFFDLDSAKEFLKKQIKHKPPIVHPFET
jgi:hypothetical protein